MPMQCKQQTSFPGHSLFPLQRSYLQNEPKMHVKEEHTLIFALTMKAFVDLLRIQFKFESTYLFVLDWKSNLPGRNKSTGSIHGK